MGHDSARAAMIYQHATAEADHAIADALDKRIQDVTKPATRPADDGQAEDDDGTEGVPTPAG